MPILYPDILEHNNPAKALVDITQLRGSSYPLGILSETGSIPTDKRKLGAIVFVSSSQQFYGFYGQTTSSADWNSTSNWKTLSTFSGSYTGSFTGNLFGTASYSLNSQKELFTFYTTNERLDDWASTILNTTPTIVSGSLNNTTTFLGEIQAFEIVNDSVILEVLDEDGNNITGSLGIPPTSLNSGIYFSSPSGSYFSSITLGQSSNQIVNLYLYQDSIEYDPSIYITTSSIIIENDIYINQGDIYGNLIGTSSYTDTAGTSTDSINSASISVDNNITLYKNLEPTYNLQIKPFKYYNNNIQLNDWADGYLNYNYGTSSLSGSNTKTGSFSIIEILTPTIITAISSSQHGDIKSKLGILYNPILSPGIYFSGYPNIITFTTLSLASGNVRLYHTASLPITYEGTYFTDNSIKIDGGITGSLFGTTSFSTQALSSSYALTASFALNGGGGSTNTGSLLTTASVNLNTITFTKGNGSTFPITINTGSGGGGGGAVTKITAGSSISISPESGVGEVTVSYAGGGGAFPFTGSAIITGSLLVIGSTIITGSLLGTASISITESRTITFNLGSIPTPLTTGSKTTSIFYSPYSGSIKGFILTSNTGSSTTLNIWKRNNTLPTSSDTIITTNKPQLINNQFTSSYNVSGWTTSFSPNDVFLINVESNNSSSYLSLQLITEIYK
jgi:hypothetical protein